MTTDEAYYVCPFTVLLILIILSTAIIYNYVSARTRTGVQNKYDAYSNYRTFKRQNIVLYYASENAKFVQNIATKSFSKIKNETATAVERNRRLNADFKDLLQYRHKHSPSAGVPKQVARKFPQSTAVLRSPFFAGAIKNFRTNFVAIQTYRGCVGTLFGFLMFVTYYDSVSR